MSGHRHHTVRGQAHVRELRGVVLLAFLLALALGGIALMAAVDVASVERQRAREQELLYVGDQYRQAIQRYYLGAPPGSRRTLPSSFEVLLEDDRYPVPVRHLRRLYPDPITGSSEWGAVRLGERIAGVYSLSEKEPLKKAGFPQAYQHFVDRLVYREWVFAIPAAGQATNVIPTPPGMPASSPRPSDPSRPARRTPS